MTWKFEKIEKKIPKLNNPVLIEGLPGIGNIGKVAVDFIIDELHAKKLYNVTSHSMPHSVFVNEENLVELPSIEMYYKKMKGKQDILLLAGDVQPIDEESSYSFSESLLQEISKLGCKEVITLGGIGLPDVPKKPKVYCTGNSKKMLKKYTQDTGATSQLYGVVGPIVGVSGLLLGLAKKQNIEAASLLAESLGHPMYLGVKGAREILKILNKKLSLNIKLKELDKEIKAIESELKKSTDLSKVKRNTALKKIQGQLGSETTYIG